MIGSRLYERRQKMTITVYSRNSAGTESAVSGLSSVSVTHTQQSARELIAEFGNIVTDVVDIFWFGKISGTLPTITEKHLIRDASSTRYEIIGVVNQGGESNRLKIITTRVRQ